jgi:hypothetical protein
MIRPQRDFNGHSCGRSAKRGRYQVMSLVVRPAFELQRGTGVSLTTPLLVALEGRDLRLESADALIELLKQGSLRSNAGRSSP